MSEIGSDYIKLTRLYSDTPKSFIIMKINEISPKVNDELSLSYRNEHISKILNALPRLVEMWLNPRRDGKIPLIKLCELAEHYGLDVTYFLNNENCQSDS